MREDDLIYFQRRAEAETLSAGKGKCAKSAAVHYQLATMYFERVEECRQPTVTILG